MKSSKKKLYVLVRKDLDPDLAMAQAGHAIAQFVLNYPTEFNQWQNNDLICLETKSLMTLIRDKYRLIRNDIVYAGFHEPNMNDEMTAICFYSDEKFAGRFQLYSTKTKTNGRIKTQKDW